METIARIRWEHLVWGVPIMKFARDLGLRRTRCTRWFGVMRPRSATSARRYTKPHAPPIDYQDNLRRATQGVNIPRRLTATVGPRVHICPSVYPPIACRNRENAHRAVGSARSCDTDLPMPWRSGLARLPLAGVQMTCLFVHETVTLSGSASLPSSRRRATRPDLTRKDHKFLRHPNSGEVRNDQTKGSAPSLDRVGRRVQP